MQILQFPDSSWGLTVLKNIFLRFIGLKGLKMVWEKSSLIWNFFPWFWLKKPCFSLISLTGKSLQKFPWIPWFPWSVGTLIDTMLAFWRKCKCTRTRWCLWEWGLRLWWWWWEWGEGSKVILNFHDKHRNIGGHLRCEFISMKNRIVWSLMLLSYIEHLKIQQI